MGSNRHWHKSIRLPDHDYASPGTYFITICVEERRELFGLIADGELVPSEAGLMVESWWCNLQSRFSSTLIGCYVVMPNHVHGLISVGTDPALVHDRDGIAGQSPPSLSEIVGWFKSITTHDYGRGVQEFGWTPYSGRLWQRSFYEHIVRNDQDLSRIEEYISNNPANWAHDEMRIGP